jgi:hypothetical protein
MSVPTPEAGWTAMALLLLNRTDQTAADELLTKLSTAELLDVSRWLSRVLSARCGWSTEAMATWRLQQELVS